MLSRVGFCETGQGWPPYSPSPPLGERGWVREGRWAEISAARQKERDARRFRETPSPGKGARYGARFESQFASDTQALSMRGER
jgi:hypothetical protein